MEKGREGEEGVAITVESCRNGYNYIPSYIGI